MVVQCVGCRRTLQNEKAYSNHRRACKKYKAAPTFHLQLMRNDRAKKVEEARVSHAHIIIEEPSRPSHEGHIEDLKVNVLPFSSVKTDLWMQEETVPALRPSGHPNRCAQLPLRVRNGASPPRRRWRPVLY